MDVQKCELRGSDGMSGHARVGPPGFEPESMAPEATRIPSYPTGPQRTPNGFPDWIARSGIATMSV